MNGIDQTGKEKKVSMKKMIDLDTHLKADGNNHIKSGTIKFKIDPKTLPILNTGLELAGRIHSALVDVLKDKDWKTAFKVYEEIEIENQKLLHKAGFDITEKSTDALTSLIDAYTELKADFARLDENKGRE